MRIEYDINCFDRTLCAVFPKEYAEHKDDILKLLEGYYYAWHADNDPCDGCEEYMMDRLWDDYQWECWTSIDWEEEK